MPDVGPTVATAPLLVVQVPPVAVFPRVVVAPTHTLAVPEIDDGAVTTVNMDVAAQPVDILYVIIAVPNPAPVKLPEPDKIEATDTLLLLHVPPVVPSLKVVEEPRHTLVAPLIGTGVRFTVTFCVARHPVPNV